MADTWGHSIRLTLFGESHGACVGMVLDGVRAGLKVDSDAIAAEMARRAPGKDALTSARREADEVRVLSGVYEGHTNGAPLCVMIENNDARSADYDALRGLARPGHADMAAHVKHHGFEDARGGGHFSGRLTAPLVCAGAILRPLIKARGIQVSAWLEEAGGETGQAARDAIARARDAGDSVGGVVKCVADGLPVGLGEPFFDGMESALAHMLFAIPAVKGVEFGDGFALARMRGSEANDAYRLDAGIAVPASNHQGGLSGGLTNGMPLVVRAAFKPTPTLSIVQDMGLLSGGVKRTVIGGRHDPCVAVRGTPCVEAAVIMVLADALGGEGLV